MQEKRYVFCDPQAILNSVQVHRIPKEEICVMQKLEVHDMAYIYKQMLRIRFIDQIMDREYRKKNIRGFCHLSVGQEGIYAALEYAMDDDIVVASYRCHGLAYVTGCKTLEIMGEVFGRQIGVCKGKGGSMHLYNKNFFGGHGIVGAQVPLGLGISYALEYRRRLLKDESQGSKVCYAFYGDGAANQGQVWESFNMAMVWKLPIVFVCENNRYGMWTSAESVSADTNFYLRGGTIPGVRVPHNNIFGLISVLKYAKKYSSKKGPIIIQVDTYRFCTHSTADSREAYRAEGEMDSERKNDCMEDVRRRLLTFYTEEEIDTMKSRTLEEVERDVDAAKRSKPTEKNELFKDILL
ncbi:pyruvate dehydrogenase E1 component subunit alpha [Encephalitozoon hellem ATCC 50504]|uniref:Pyruvate dehydrogenase E1 component subunit alpha n=1 Tax=Encephalitozoon hellem TaxID=27973 RepID=A0A9Q9CDN9_ENCHE|nr:pyruvate dehydrogenase E1 component subunit alpha [Encephalitozoon hellem ATCC 50504]AFM98998.1 pyruvate dehydrogenase E1 component subunit alpha [Encephalitozoon hellem ATCC 50504]UTX44014.1 pyruvate dehydrogenase E1 component subunit alpha [Encephalitozoon hellem]|eukprot:XP_003887979.1 pyruvate dehydrogenase E1 component subunit alpha [Encephalitozoon hellem ATCC 50504]